MQSSHNQQNPRSRTPSKRVYHNVFPPYISEDEAIWGIKTGRFLSGPIRIHKKDRYDSYVSIPGREQDIRVYSLKCRNRALEGDHVVVEILEGAELAELMRRLVDSEERKASENDARERKVKTNYENLEEEIVDPFVAASQATSELKADNKNNTEDSIYQYGKVVFITERRPNQTIPGTLSIDIGGNRQQNKSDKNQTEEQKNELYNQKKLCWFKPIDKRFPHVAISIDHAPSDFLKNPLDYEQTLFSASILDWPATSNHPFGKINGPIGQMGELHVETQALLTSNGIDWEQFPDDIHSCLPQLPWSIPPEEYSTRIDMRNYRVFSIDPQTAKDLDDALSVESLGEGVYRVGVHIADVSYFVEPNNQLDKEAEHRATTVYLVQKAIPMLPRILCEQLCSLNPGVERLSFSVFWKMDQEGFILEEPQFGRTIIKSCAKMSYDHAQALLDGVKDLTQTSLPPLKIENGWTLEQVREDVTLLHKMSLKMRERRFLNGSLTMQNIKLWFSLDDNGNPIQCGPYQLKESNRLIEEFMLQANMSVAKKICQTYPELALLRNHGEPQSRAMKEFLNLASDLGFTIDDSSSRALQQSFDNIDNDDHRMILRHLCIRPMQRAKYFCSGLEDILNYRHFALACPLYTHFTSPIRRYCDVIVHRLLQCALDGVPAKKMSGQLGLNTERVGDIAKWCNMRKEASKNAQDASQKLYLCAYITKLAEEKPVFEEGFVYRIGTRSVDVLIPTYGIDSRLFVEDLIDDSEAFGAQYDESKKVLVVYWRKPNVENDITQNMKQLSLKESGPTKGNSDQQHLAVFDKVMVKIQVNMKKSPPDIKCKLHNPFTTAQKSKVPDALATDVICLGLLDEAD